MLFLGGGKPAGRLVGATAFTALPDHSDGSARRMVIYGLLPSSRDPRPTG
jgi:hypothetical protein